MRAAEQCDKAVSLFHHRQRGFYKVRQCSNLTVREQSRCQMTSSSFPRIVRNVCICQQFRPEALNGAVNVLEDEWWHSYKLWHVLHNRLLQFENWYLRFVLCLLIFNTFHSLCAVCCLHIWLAAADRHRRHHLVSCSSRIASPNKGKKKHLTTPSVSLDDPVWCNENTRKAHVSYLLSSKARAGANRTQVLLLPLVAHPVSFAIIVTRGLICVNRYLG